jgi:hypothetical protein
MGHDIPECQITLEAVFGSRCFPSKKRDPKRPAQSRGATNGSGEAALVYNPPQYSQSIFSNSGLARDSLVVQGPLSLNASQIGRKRQERAIKQGTEGVQLEKSAGE